MGLSVPRTPYIRRVLVFPSNRLKMALQRLRKGKGPALFDDDPTESLKCALEKFRKVLTTEQQRQFSTGATVPDAGGVLFFVAQLDAENSSKARRSMAPRLCTFLNATQQFAGVVNTFVSSNPQIAALVWGGVKTAILVASNVASYFDKVTNMIMEIGRSCPTYQEFGHLYHGCVGLQNALCGYYAAIIEMCIKIVEISRRTAAIQTISSIFNPFEADFKPFLDQLDKATKEIHLQVLLASNKAEQESRDLQEYESRENASFRPTALNFLRKSAEREEQARQWQVNQTRREVASLKEIIRQNLCSVDHLRPWKRALRQRVQSTAEWLMKESSFLEWRNCHGSKVFWCAGRMGMGKTVLMSNIVSHLHANRKESERISHFFCVGDNEETLSARNVVGSISRQLLYSLIEKSGHDDLVSLKEKSQDLSTDETVEFLSANLAAGETYYIGLDGVDECNPTQIRELARALGEICTINNIAVKVICTGRPELEEVLFRGQSPDYRLIIDQRNINPDIDRYIAALIKDCLDEDLLVLRDNEIVPKIVRVLREKAEGMFLWVRLCINDLCDENSDEDILTALDNLPSGLVELLDSILHRVETGKEGSQAMALLRYCGVVKRPLSVEEYREVLAVSPEDQFLEFKKLPNSINRIIRGCYGLTFIDEEENTVHYIHQSVKEHLFSTDSTPTATLTRFDSSDTEKYFGILCMTYLNFSNFRRQVAKTQKSGGSVSPLRIGELSIDEQFPVANKIARKVFKQDKTPAGIDFRKIERIAFQGLETSRPGGADEMATYSFLAYAKDNWIHHLKELTPEPQIHIWSLFCKCIEDASLPLNRPWDSLSSLPSIELEGCSSGQEERNEILVPLLLVEKLSPPYSFGRLPWPISYVNWVLFAKEIALCLDIPSEKIFWTMEEGHLPLFVFFLRRKNLSENVNYMLETFPLTKDDSGFAWSHLVVQSDILRSKYTWVLALKILTDKDLPFVSKLPGCIQLVNKMATQDEKLTRNILLGAMTSSLVELHYDHYTPITGEGFFRLILAIDKAQFPSERVAQELRLSPEELVVGILRDGEGFTEFLPPGIDFNIEDSFGNTALHLAVNKDLNHVASILAATGANVHLKNKQNYSSLDLAIKRKNKELLAALVTASYDVDLRDRDGQSGLHLASSQGDIHYVKLLLDAGMNVNLRNGQGQTCLHQAVISNSIDIVELMEAGLDVDIADSHGNTALHLAAAYGFLRSVISLLEFDANVSLIDHEGQTALHKAAQHNKKPDIVFYLLGEGADIDATDLNGETPLHIAARNGNTGVVSALVDSGANVDVKDHAGRTPLHEGG